MKRSKLVVTLTILLVSFFIGIICYVISTFAAIPEMFRLNGELQSQGYYMGEFEFKMLGCAYYLDHGQYLTAFKRLNQLETQLKTRKGLIKLPKFKDKRAEMNFYLSLQNPRTGAFMDDDYPLPFYFDPTANQINHLAYLAKATGQPLRLRYPLRFMKELDTPEELKRYLDDLSTVGLIGSKMPKTSYIMAAQLSYYDDFEQNHLYTFSPAWKHALLEWFYQNQDSRTGTWGPRLRNSGELIGTGDLNPTLHIIRLFVDDQGNNRYPEYPLRFKSVLFANVLRQLNEPMPNDDSSAKVHDWTLTRLQGIKILTRDLWNDAPLEDKNKARAAMIKLVQNRFDRFYLPEEGAFVYYPGSNKATLDGTGMAIFLLKNVGALSQESQQQLWGPPLKTIKDLGTNRVQEITNSSLAQINAYPEVNSIRIYQTAPRDTGLDSNVAGILYPAPTAVLDLLELLPKLVRWTTSTSQTVGNWTSREDLLQNLKSEPKNDVLIVHDDVALTLVNEILNQNGEVVCVGYNALQVPVCRITFDRR